MDGTKVLGPEPPGMPRSASTPCLPSRLLAEGKSDLALFPSVTRVHFSFLSPSLKPVSPKYFIPPHILLSYLCTGRGSSACQDKRASHKKVNKLRLYIICDNNSAVPTALSTPPPSMANARVPLSGRCNVPVMLLCLSILPPHPLVADGESHAK
ncbi:uncharacterized protein LY79DRAFT_103075 [Colletotrichum navitas]|uniref:Uncharacterized protein n=1 Tax=Colletotrichum navitas TaxID=681940 RepID=A0AAD8V634_9PEZI|nr:uncharacterized protein LY79DRAFT_103075 [Colletotrichum navitas]KAK1595622.1 hypothetical protein LY79DRAFT_103075 [Colletotrichum navitas]